MNNELDKNQVIVRRKIKIIYANKTSKPKLDKSIRVMFY